MEDARDEVEEARSIANPKGIFGIPKKIKQWVENHLATIKEMKKFDDDPLTLRDVYLSPGSFVRQKSQIIKHINDAEIWGVREKQKYIARYNKYLQPRVACAIPST